jgi:hypothetical protein
MAERRERRSRWERYAEALESEERERADWQATGRPETLWAVEAAGQRIEVVESDADSTGKRRKRRVHLGSLRELTSKQALELSEALARAAEHARRGRS